ncbi:MAG: hypothetical protein RL701_3281 [Pseudomonadota bacterium]|jgi:hypothetical protein
MSWLHCHGAQQPELTMYLEACCGDDLRADAHDRIAAWEGIRYAFSRQSGRFH